MNQEGTRLTLIAGLCAFIATALILYSCGGGGGGGGNGGGGGGGGAGTTISNSDEASQAAVVAATSVINAVSTVGGLGFTFTKPILEAHGKTIAVPNHSKDPRIKAAGEIRAKMMAGKGMQQKMALMKSRMKAGTAQLTVSFTTWFSCDNYNGTDADNDPAGPNGTTGYFIFTDTYDDVNFVPETYESTDVNCQFFDLDSEDNVTGGVRYDGTIEFGETNYTAGPGANDFSSDYFSREHGATVNDPYVFEFYTNTTNATNVTDLTTLTRDSFFESIYSMEGSYSGTSEYNDTTGEGSGDTDFTLNLAGEEHFGTGALDFTFTYDDLTEEGTFSWDDAGFESADYEDHTSATVNGGFGFDFTAEIPDAKPAASVGPLVTVASSMSVSFTDAQYNDDYTEDATGFDDRYDIDGQVTVNYVPEGVCFSGTFDISTPKRIHENETAFCPIDGKFEINGNTTVTFNSNESVDVSVNGDTTHYDDCLELDTTCAALAGLTGGL